MGRIGIFGGSFNPPHAGHVQAAAAARQALGLERVLLIPAAIPPHKALPAGSPDAATRLALTRLAVQALPWAEVSDMELRRSGPSYTVDTLRALRGQYPADELVLLVGTDMFLSLHEWFQAEEICRLAHIACVSRSARTEPAAMAEQRHRLEQRLHARVTLLDNPVLELSSTQVRRMLAFGCAGALLPAPVLEEILRRGLYTQPAQLRGLTLSALEAACLALLDPRRVQHVLGCRDTAVALAGRFGCDETDAARAALLHDVTKALPTAHQLQLGRQYGMIKDDFTQMQPQLLHAATGAAVAQHVFGENAAVCGAVRWHTTGRPDMTRLEKILYLADMIEPGRSYPEVEGLRRAVWDDLDRGLLQALGDSIAWLREKGAAVSPETLQAHAWLTEALT